MTTFKEQSLTDLETILNPKEFAEIIEIQGQETAAVLELRRGQPEGNQGIIIEELEIRTAAEGLPDLKVDQEITINGESYFLRSIEQEMGLTVLFAYRNVT